MKEFWNKLKSTEKGRTCIKLSGYMLFLVFVILFITLSGSNKEMSTNESNVLVESESQEESIKKLNFFEKQEKLLNEDYEFEYLISGETSIKYKGEVTNEKVHGYKQTTAGTTEYKIDETGIYQIKLNENSIYKDLYLGLNEEYFNLESLFSTINNLSAIIEKNENEKKYMYTSDDGIDYTIIANDTEITEIFIETENLTYNFKYTY